MIHLDKNMNVITIPPLGAPKPTKRELYYVCDLWPTEVVLNGLRRYSVDRNGKLREAK